MSTVQNNFDVDYIYQLNVKESRDMFFYIKIIKQGTFLEIYKSINNKQKKFLSVYLLFSPISTGWIEDNIFLQSETELYIFDIELIKLINLPSASYKILVMEKWKEKYIYGTIKDFDCIEFYEYKYQKRDERIGIYSFLDNKLKRKRDLLLLHKYPFIEAYISNLEEIRAKKINDFWNRNTLKIENSKLHTSIYINGEKTIQRYGHIDRAYLLNNGYIYTLSSFDRGQNIHFMTIKEQNKSSIIEEKNNRIKAEYFEKGSLEVPHYILHPHSKCFGNVIMVHGGPSSHYSNQYEPLAKSLVEIGLRVYLINYTGSTGYGETFKNKLYGRGGVYDFHDIKRSIKRISKCYSNCPLFVIGDSYGGYLALLCLLKTKYKVTKFYVTNTFTDLRYQYLFSKSNYIVKKYFPDVLTNTISERNPIDLVKSTPFNRRLLIINGINDPYCPFQQICQFKKETNCDVKFIKDYPHFKVGYRDQWRLYRCIIEDIREITNERN